MRSITNDEKIGTKVVSETISGVINGRCNLGYLIETFSGEILITYNGMQDWKVDD